MNAAYVSNWSESQLFTYLVVHVFDDEQHRTVHVRQAPVQSLEAGAMLHRAVGQSPGITLHTGRQAARQLEGGEEG